MEGHCSTGQSPRWAVVPMEEEEAEEEETARNTCGFKTGFYNSCSEPFI